MVGGKPKTTQPRTRAPESKAPVRSEESDEEGFELWRRDEENGARLERELANMRVFQLLFLHENTQARGFQEYVALSVEPTRC